MPSHVPNRMVIVDVKGMFVGESYVAMTVSPKRHTMALDVVIVVLRSMGVFEIAMGVFTLKRIVGRPDPPGGQK